MRTKVIIENGEVKFDAQDGVGTQCEQAHGPLIKALAERFQGGSTVQEKKPEYYQTEQTTEGDLLTE